MIRKLDKWWFHLLGLTYRWIIRQVTAHYRREKQRRLRALMAAQNQHLN